MRQGCQDSVEQEGREEVVVLHYVLLSFLAVFSAVIVAGSKETKRFSVAMPLRTAAGSATAAIGVMASIFAADGFGWGWPDLSRSEGIRLLALAGAGIGFAIGVGAWIVSSRLRLPWLGVLVLANASIALIPPQKQAVKLLVFTTANFLFVVGWASRPSRRPT